MLVGPGVEVYEGMIVGENSRADEMDVNPTKREEAHQHAVVERPTTRSASRRRGRCRSSRRSSSSPTTSASRSRPQSVRLRKVILDQAARGRLRNSKKPPKT